MNRTLVKKLVAPFPRRFAGGYMRKNKFVEENAGLREISYSTWKFDLKNTIQLFLLTVVPSFVIYQSLIWEMVLFSYWKL